jgi:hypothetical protein
MKLRMEGFFAGTALRYATAPAARHLTVTHVVWCDLERDLCTQT